jgi:hypothetical protein
MKNCVLPTTLRALAVLALLLLSTVGTSSSAFAASGRKAARPAPVSSDTYLDQLLDEINARRAQVGTQPVAYIAADANAAVASYLADLTPQMLAYNACFHGQHNPVAPGWDYVAATGLDGEARGEVLACPDDNGYWTTSRIADGWFGSPVHFQYLYADADANAIACGTYGPQRGGQAFETIACVTYRI